VMHIAIEFAGLECDCSSHAATVWVARQIGERGPTNSAREWMSGRFSGFVAERLKKRLLSE
jgi:hypothetical protein